MIKNIISCITAIAILISLGVLEFLYVSKCFNTFDERLEILEIKTTNYASTYNDVCSVKNFWLENKKILHIFIPHVEIKEIDLWLSETESLILQKNFTEALQKINVLRLLCNQTPTTFKIKTENIL